MGFAGAHVAWKGNANRLFGATEILYDVGVWEKTPCEAYLRGRQTKFIFSKLIIESELGPDATNVMFDFSKLLNSISEWKIFVGSRTDAGELDRLLGPAACRCSGNLLVYAVPKIADWTPTNNLISTWQLRTGSPRVLEPLTPAP